jgi:Domain of unknown function (DUF4328)
MAMQGTPPGQVSPDGRWMWNGTQWVPNVQAAVRQPPKPYESARYRSNLVVIFLALNGLALVLAVAVDVILIALGGSFTSAGNSAEIAIGLFSLVVLLLLYGSLVPAIVFFCMWVHRVVRNMPWIGASDPRWTPGGAVGRCFIPFLNLIHPFLSVLDVWRASDPVQLRAEQPIRNTRPAPLLLIAWWGTYIGGRVVSLVSSRLVNSNDPGTVVVGAFVDMLVNLAIAGAAVLAILVVRTVTARQDAKWDLIATGRLS